MRAVLAFALAALSLTGSPLAYAQTAASDEVCMGSVLFGSDKAVDADSRKIIGMLETYYLGKLRAKEPALTLSDAISKGITAFTNAADKEAAMRSCLANLDQDIAQLDTLNAKMSEKK